jgi:putative transposase
MPIKDICREGGFSQLTFYKWRSRFSSMYATDAAKLGDL